MNQNGVVAKRKFSTAKAYKLARAVVVTVSLILGLVGLFQIYNSEYGAYSMEENKQRCAEPNSARTGCSAYHIIYLDVLEESPCSSEEKARVMCNSYYLLERRKLSDSGLRNLGIAIVLLAVFFGGSWLFNYLFPRTHGRADEPDN